MHLAVKHKGETMTYQHTIYRIVAIAALVTCAACGSSGSGTSTSTTSTTADATQAVDSVSVNVSNLDASQSAASANISATKSFGSVLKGFGTSVGDTSRSGCELNEIKKEAMRVGNETDAILCYLGTTQDLDSHFVVDSTQRYYTMTVPAGEGESKGNFTFVMRIQKDSDGLKMDMCDNGTLSEEITISQTGLVVTATGYHHFKGEAGEDNPGAGFDDKAGFALDLTLKSSASGDIAYADIDSGALDATFVGNFGSGHLTFSKTASVDLNDISGVFAASLGSNDDFTAQIIGRTDATQGTAKYSVTGTFPALSKSMLPVSMQSLAPDGFCPMSTGFDTCNPASNFQPGGSCQGVTPTLSCFCMQAPTDGKCIFTDSGTEAFSITTDATTGTQTFAIVAGSDSNYYSYVNGLTLPSTTITTPTPTRNWDCSTTGKTVVTLDVTGFDYSVCDAKTSKGFDSSDKSSCQEQETTDKAGTDID